MVKLIPIRELRRRLYMVLVLLLVFFFFILLVAVLFIIFSTIKIKIENWKVGNTEENKKEYKIIISMHLFNKVKWFSIKLDNNKIQKISHKMHLERIDIKQLEKDVKFSDIKEIVHIKPKIAELDLKIKVGIEDVLLTTYLIPIIATIISIVLSTSAKQDNLEKIQYEVKPIYGKQNLFEIKLDTILEIKLLNLLNSVYKIYVTRKNEKSKMEKQENKINCNV